MEKMKKGLTKICHRFFINLSNPTRLAALEQLIAKPMSVNQLATVLGQEQSMISHNLKPLLQCKVITIQKQGKNHIYTALGALSKTSTEAVAVCVLNYFCFAVYDLQGAFNAFGDALTAAVAEIFVYVYDFSFHVFSSLRHFPPVGQNFCAWFSMAAKMGWRVSWLAV